MPTPTIPLWGQIISNGINNIRDVLKTAKERYNSMSPEQKAEAARVGDQWVRDNVLPTVITLGEILPQTSIPMAAYAASEAKTPEEKFQHIMMPVMMGSVGKGTSLALKASEKGIETAGRALKSADNYITIQNALRTGKLKFGEPTNYIGIHQSKTPLTKVQFPYQRWDVTTHGADPNGFWLTLADEPNTTGTMASRPYASRWSTTSQKPLIQTGEVEGLFGKKNNTRNAIVKYGRKHGADAFEFRGIRDNAIPQTDVIMVTKGTNPQYLGGVGQVRYAGPTTGKSTFIKANSQSNFVDLDAISGYKQLRKDIAEQLGLDWKSPKVTDSPEYQQAFNNFIREWTQNTENSGKTLFGSAKGLLRGDNPLSGQPFIPDFKTFVTRNQARGFRENPEQLRAWYNSIVDSYPEIKIDNRFVGEIPFYNAPKTSAKSIQMEEPIMAKPQLGEKGPVLRRKISKGQWTKIIENNGRILPLNRERGQLRFTPVKPRKADFYIETDVPVSEYLAQEASPRDYFAKGAFSERFKADKDFRPSIYDESVKVFRKNADGKYTLLPKNQLNNINFLQFGIDQKPIYTEKPIRLSEHRIHVPEAPVQTADGTTLYLDEALSQYSPTKLRDYQVLEPDLYANGTSYYDPKSGDFVTPHGSKTGNNISTLKSKINNVNEPSDIARSMISPAKKYYLEKYDVAADALSDQEWAQLMQTLLEKHSDKEILFHSTVDDFDKVLKSELLKANEGYLGRGFYTSDIPQTDYGPRVLPVLMPKGKQIVLSTVKSGTKAPSFLHADNTVADQVLTSLRKPMVRWTKKGFQGREWGYWPGMIETSKDPTKWNQLIKDLDLNFVKSTASSKGIGYKYPEVLIPEDKIDLIEMLFKAPSELKQGGKIKSVFNPQQ